MISHATTTISTATRAPLMYMALETVSGVGAMGVRPMRMKKVVAAETSARTIAT